jgi:hypothetical protein
MNNKNIEDNVKKNIFVNYEVIMHIYGFFMKLMQNHYFY